MQETGDLLLINFYYLLRCGEYTSPRYVFHRNSTLNRDTRTNQFTVGDVGFWKGGFQFPHNLPFNLLPQAEYATLKITY